MFSAAYLRVGRQSEEDIIMSWADKALRKNRLEKKIDEAMKNPRYKREQQKHDMKVFCVYCLISADFLSRQEGYKKKRMKRFLSHVKEQMKYIADDPEYDFGLLNEALKDETGMDVMEYMGFYEEGKE